jgi:Caspase domain/PAN domain
MSLVIAAFLAWVLALPALADTRVALVIGNASYANTTALPNTRNDARAVAEKLTSIGFDVSLYEDLDGQSFRVALGDFSEKALNSDLAVVYYAGHGIEMQGQNYLIPVDAKMRSESTAQYEAVPLEQVLSAVREAGVLGMVMLDACRNNPFAATMTRKSGTRSVSRGLAPISVEGESGLVVSFAAEAGQTAADGDAEHSPYAAALLQVLDQPGLEVGRMFRSVRAKVKVATNGEQVPIEQMQLPDSEIYLVAAAADGTQTVVTKQITKSEPVEDPMVIYLAAVRSGNPTELESYLSRFPQHEMADQARRILLDYADDDLWASSQSRNTARDYRVYLMAFPSGRHRDEAQALLDALDTPAVPEPPAVPQFEVIADLDLMGGDLTTNGYRGISLEACQNQCSVDGSCVAYTYVQAKQWCWTKGSIGTRAYRSGMISALKTTGSATASVAPPPAPPAEKVLKLYADLDIPGFDLTTDGIRNISLADCEVWCRANSACTAFSYVEHQNWCWPKYGVGTSNAKIGVISGQLE